jgi:hypothetical protein
MAARIVPIVPVHRHAPAQPAIGAPCNGCGVCCLAEPCPLGMLVSGRRSGACAAVFFDAAESRYRCRMLTDPRAHWPWLPQPMAGAVRRLAHRWIAAATGCDSIADDGPRGG